MELGDRIPDNRLWVFTSSSNYDVLSSDGSLEILEQAGALLLKDTCPEVTPYNRDLYNHILTNSMKAEHYLKSGLNSMPTSVARISDCVAHAFDPNSQRDLGQNYPRQNQKRLDQSEKINRDR